MRKSKFSEEQIIGVLKELEAGAKVAEDCLRLGISEQTLHRWKVKFDKAGWTDICMFGRRS